MAPLDKAGTELVRYDHLLLTFGAVEDFPGQVNLIISLKAEAAGAHDYRARVHSQVIAHPQFAWTFEKFLYDCMHDCLCELFITKPQESPIPVP